MLDHKCKKCRRIGDKLFLKGERCLSVKCAVLRKPYPPGPKGKEAARKGKRGGSEFGAQLQAKQKVKFGYGLRSRQYMNYTAEAREKGKGDSEKGLMENLELRLDNVVYRLGFSDARSKTRQVVSHGHIMVNGRRVDIPSYRLKIGDKVSIRPQSESKAVFKDLDIKLKKYNPPAWLGLDKTKKEGVVVGKPTI